jgi:hypothetical protein
MILFTFLAAGNDAKKKKSYRKVQEVNFSEMSLKGSIRNPDGSYLVQKKGIKFLPLYEVQKNFDEKIRKSSRLVE